MSTDLLFLWHFLDSYSQVVVKYPLAVLVGCAVVLLGCSLAGLLIGPLPDFSDPLMVSASLCSTVAFSANFSVKPNATVNPFF